MFLQRGERELAKVGHPDVERAMGSLARLGLSASFPTGLQNFYEAMCFLYHKTSDCNVSVDVPKTKRPDYAEIIYDGKSNRIDILGLASGITKMYVGPIIRIIDGKPDIRIPHMGYLPAGAMSEFFAAYPGNPDLTIRPVTSGFRSGRGQNEGLWEPAVMEMPASEITSKDDITKFGFEDMPLRRTWSFRAGFQQQNASFAMNMVAMNDPTNSMLTFRVEEVSVQDTPTNLEAIMNGMSLWLDKPIPLQKIAP